MKILVISILRIGDVFLSLPAMRALRAKYPQASIDIMVNKPYAKSIRFLKCADHIIEFDRKDIQDSLVSADRPVFESYDMLSEFVQGLNANKYDLVINLTQNKLSGYISSMIYASEHIGLTINSNDQASFGSSWFKYLNDVVACGAETIFHYSDIFYFGVGGKKGQQDWTIEDSVEGQEQVENFYRENGYKTGPRIVVQALTSDNKKNWGANNLVQALGQLKIFIPDSQIILLGAPAETLEIDNLIQKLKDKNVKASKAILSFEGAHSLLSSSDLLITGDTSIKHLAGATPIKILEIALGSSDPRKTGAYKAGSLILKSRVGCAPCEHSRPCPRSQHDCGISIAPELVSLAAKSILQNDLNGIKLLAEEYEDQVYIYNAQNSQLGFWNSKNLHKKYREDDLDYQIEKLAWQFLLQKEHQQTIGIFGSESSRLKDELSEDLDSRLENLLRESLTRIESKTQEVEARLFKILGALSKEIRSADVLSGMDFLNSHLKSEIECVERDLKLGHFLSEKMNIDKSMGLFRIRQLQNSLTDTFSLQQIKLKLLRDIKSQFKEKS